MPQMGIKIIAFLFLKINISTRNYYFSLNLDYRNFKMPQTATISQIPLNNLDKEVLDFWRLKNRTDYIQHYRSELARLCSELKEESFLEKNHLEPLTNSPLTIQNHSSDDANVPIIQDQDSLSLDVTSSVDIHLDLEPSQPATISNIESAEESTNSTETLEAASPVIATYADVVQSEAQVEGPTVDQVPESDIPTLPKQQISEWRIIRKRSPPAESYYLAKHYRDDEVIDTLGPFNTLQEAKDAIPTIQPHFE